MRKMSPLDSMGKFPASVLLSSPQSDIFPGMVKITYSDSQKSPQKTAIISPEATQEKNSPTILNHDNSKILPIGLAALAGLAVGRGTAKMIERPIDNLPAGLIGAAVCGTMILGTTGFYIAQYGGFFDKDRDFKTMFKNL